MNLGDKLKQLRLQNDFTQEELADRCELTKGYISQLENEVTSPSIATLKDILDALGSTLAEFFAEEKEELIKYCVKVVNKRVPVIVGVGSNNTMAVIENEI